MKTFKLFLILVLTLSMSGFSQDKSSTYDTSVKEITEMLHQDAKHWNEGNIEAFMESYVKSDSLVFIGSKGLTYGWQQTLENYKKGYPTKDHMGTLVFDLLEFKQLNTDIFFVIGKFSLTRKVGDASGHFSLILKRINDEWKIIADHSS